jgi:hypothetical protein
MVRRELRLSAVTAIPKEIPSTLRNTSTLVATDAHSARHSHARRGAGTPEEVTYHAEYIEVPTVGAYVVDATIGNDRKSASVMNAPFGTGTA